MRNRLEVSNNLIRSFVISFFKKKAKTKFCTFYKEWSYDRACVMYTVNEIR